MQRNVPQAWRYEIQHGPDGEQNYAFVYDGSGSLVSNLKIHHAVQVCEATNRAARSDALADALRAVMRSADNQGQIHFDESGELGQVIARALASHEQGKSAEDQIDAARDVLAERRRQVDAEGWTSEHDDSHECGELALAASLYAFHAHDEMAHNHGVALSRRNICPQQWPWAGSWWKPKDRRSDLVRAGALILAEIERLDRAAPTQEGDQDGR